VTFAKAVLSIAPSTLIKELQSVPPMGLRWHT
jgi:hypothetical protein